MNPPLIDALFLIFSKDRALQLDALLRSLRAACADSSTAAIRVIYTCTDRRHEDSYAQLAKEHASVTFVRETSFDADLRAQLALAHHVCFLVDDCVFVRPWSLCEAIKLLAGDGSVLGVSLRLGVNIDYCYPLSAEKTPPEMEPRGSLRSFVWIGAQHDFGYPLEVSSSIYRTADVFSALGAQAIKGPNHLEVVLNDAKAKFAESRPTLLCFPLSVAFCIPLNVVQQAFMNRTSLRPDCFPERLRQLYRFGYRINTEALSGLTPRGCHQDVPLVLVPPAKARAVTLKVSCELPSGAEPFVGAEALDFSKASFGQASAVVGLIEAVTEPESRSRWFSEVLDQHNAALSALDRAYNALPKAPRENPVLMRAALAAGTTLALATREKLALSRPPAPAKTFRGRVRRFMELSLRPEAGWVPGRPLASIIIPCYNYGKFLPEALQSALDQTLPPVEIIVVNDGSTDAHTLEVLAGIDHPRVRVLHQENKKLPEARNAGIREARGQFICCLDADDRLDPTYLEKCILTMYTRGLEICGSWFREFGDSGETVSPDERDFTYGKFLKKNRMPCAAVFRRALWERIGPYRKDLTVGYEDWEFWTRAAASGARAGIVPEPLFFYRKHGRSMIDAAREADATLSAAIRASHGAFFRARSFFTRNLRLNTPVPQPRSLPCAASVRPRVMLFMGLAGIGGAERVLSLVAQELSRAEFDFTLVTTEDAGPRGGDAKEWFRKASPSIFDLRRCCPEKHRKAFAVNLVATERPTIIWLAGCVLAYEILPEIFKVCPDAFVVDILFNDVGHVANHAKYLPYINATLTESAILRNRLAERGEAVNRIHVVPNGVDVDHFSVAEAEGSRPLRKAEDRFLVGFIGRFSEEKGPDVFVDIAAAVARRSPEVTFLMAGDGPMGELVRGKVAEHKLGERLRLPGFVDARDFYRSCDLVILSSRLDGRPNSIMESMACGVPVIAAQVGGVPEIIEDGLSGLLCPAGDVEAFASAVCDLVAKPTRLRELSLAARRRAVEQFDMRAMLAKYRTLFEVWAGRSISA